MPLTKADLSRLRSLQEKKHREALGLFVVEGEKVVGELLAAEFPFSEIYATETWTARASRPDEPPSAAIRSKRSSGDGSPCLKQITSDEMARISHYPTPSSVLAVGRIERFALDPGALAHGLTLALDGIQDPGNVGTLLRIADWFAFDRVLLSPDSADLFSQKVINASMGSFARVPTFTVPLAEALTGTAVPILGCALEGADVHTLSPLRDAVVVLGSEGRGLSAAVKKLVSRYVTIPRGRAGCGRPGAAAESLNAAVAAAIVCDNLRRLAPARQLTDGKPAEGPAQPEDFRK
jgi:TrmH family RNA methyltransferase